MGWAAPRRCSAAATSPSRSCTDRAARTARSPRSASSAGLRVRRVRGPRRARSRWTRGDQAGRRVARHRHGTRTPGDGRDGRHLSPGRARSSSSRSPPAPASASPWSPSPRTLRRCSRRGARARLPGRWSRRSSSAARSTWPCSRRADGSLMVPPALEIVARRSLRLRREVRRPRRLPRPGAARPRWTQGARGRRGRGVRRPRLRRRRPRRLLPDRGRPGAQRGQHRAGDDRALAGAPDVRRGRACPTPSSSTSSSAAPTGDHGSMAWFALTALATA